MWRFRERCRGSRETGLLLIVGSDFRGRPCGGGADTGGGGRIKGSTDLCVHRGSNQHIESAPSASRDALWMDVQNRRELRVKELTGVFDPALKYVLPDLCKLDMST